MAYGLKASSCHPLTVESNVHVIPMWWTCECEEFLWDKLSYEDIAEYSIVESNQSKLL